MSKAKFKISASLRSAFFRKIQEDNKSALYPARVKLIKLSPTSENQGQQPSTSNDGNSRTRDTSPLRVNSPRNSRISPFHRRHNRPNQNQNPLGQQPFSLTVPGASVAPGDWAATVPPGMDRIYFRPNFPEKRQFLATKSLLNLWTS